MVDVKGGAEGEGGATVACDFNRIAAPADRVTKRDPQETSNIEQPGPPKQAGLSPQT